MRSPAPRAPTPSFIYRDAVPIYVLAQIVTASTQLAAVLFGALWVLSLYRLNRSSVPRLQLNLQAKTRRIKDAWCLSASFEVHNIGSTMVSFREPLDPKGGPGGCAIILIPLAPRATPLTAMRTPVRQRRYIHDILKLYGLERHQSVEPGNVIREHVLLQLPEGLEAYDAFEIQLRVSIKSVAWRQRLLLVNWPNRFFTNVMVFRGSQDAGALGLRKEENGDGNEHLPGA